MRLPRHFRWPDAARYALFAGAVGELIDRSRLCGPTVRALCDRFGTEGMIAPIATAGYYSSLGFLLNTAGTPIDDDIAGALARNPLGGRRP